MTETKMVIMQESELESLLDRVCRKAVLEAFAEKDDELLNIDQLCKKIPGLTRHLFKKLSEESKLKCVRGKYSLKAVKDAMQSR